MPGDSSIALPTPPLSGDRVAWRGAEAPRRPVLFVNPRSGGGTAHRSGLGERASEMGIEVVELGGEHDPAVLAGEMVDGGADALGVAGGDGSLAAVAAVAASQEVPFVCIPAGTRNHFALDVGVDRSDVLGALAAFTEGVERRIDIAEVNGRVFLNNVSLGVYGEAVRQPTYRDAKLATLVKTAQRVLGPSRRAFTLRVVDDRGHEHRDPLLLLVSNNPYAIAEPPGGPMRPSLGEGRLGLIALARPAGGLEPLGRAWSAAQIDAAADETLHAGIDGEAVDLSPPLHFTMRPSALRVRIARGHASRSPGARA